MRRKVHKVTLLVLLQVILLITGCWDKVEINERAFVLTQAIDVENGMLKVTYSVPNLPVITGQGGDGEKRFIKTTQGETLEEANIDFRKINSMPLSFDHTRVLIFGPSLLQDDQMLRTTLDYLDRDSQYAKSLLVITTGKSAEELSKIEPNSPLVLGLYVEQYFENKASGDLTIESVELQQFLTELKDTEGNGHLSIMDTEGKELKINGVAFIKDYKQVGTITDEQATYYNWLKGNGVGTEETFKEDETSVHYRISEIKRSVQFKETDAGLNIHILIQTEGDIKEYGKEGENIYDAKKISEFEKKLKETMEQDVSDIIRIAQKDIGFDIFNLSDVMKVSYGKLWKKVEKDWEAYFKSAKITVEISPNIRRIGMAK